MTVTSTPDGRRDVVGRRPGPRRGRPTERDRLRRRRRALFGPPRDQRGEGVISAAIAVLVMAFIGVAMWVAFNLTFQHTAKHVNDQVNCIGQTSGSC